MSMILTDYYLMKELKPTKSHRFDCIKSTGEYEQFEAIARRARSGRFYFYYNGVPDTFSEDARAKAERAITSTFNISSVFIPDIKNPLLGYGDVSKTNDALLFIFSSDYKQIEVFVARGYKNDARGLCEYCCKGDIYGEMAQLRDKAQPTMILQMA